MMILKIITNDLIERMWVENPNFLHFLLQSCFYALRTRGHVLSQKIVSKPLNLNIDPHGGRWLLRSGCVWGSKKTLGFFKRPFSKTYQVSGLQGPHPPTKRSQIDFCFFGNWWWIQARWSGFLGPLKGLLLGTTGPQTTNQPLVDPWKNESHTIKNKFHPKNSHMPYQGGIS